METIYSGSKFPFLAQCRAVSEIFCDEKHTALFRIILVLIRFCQSRISALKLWCRLYMKLFFISPLQDLLSVGCLESSAFCSQVTFSSHFKNGNRKLFIFIQTFQKFLQSCVLLYLIGAFYPILSIQCISVLWK